MSDRLSNLTAEISELVSASEGDPRAAGALAQIRDAWSKLHPLGLTDDQLAHLSSLLDAVYNLGVHEGACNPYC